MFSWPLEVHQKCSIDLPQYPICCNLHQPIVASPWNGIFSLPPIHHQNPCRHNKGNLLRIVREILLSGLYFRPLPVYRPINLYITCTQKN